MRMTAEWAHSTLPSLIDSFVHSIRSSGANALVVAAVIIATPTTNAEAPLELAALFTYCRYFIR